MVTHWTVLLCGIGLRALSIYALLLCTYSLSVAQVTGKVTGTVTDGDTGQPLVGAQVVQYSGNH